MKLKCIIIDDEPIARKSIEAFIAATDFLELTGQAENPAEAIALLHSNVIDLIFLDITMLSINGYDFLKNANAAGIIITVAGVEYAVEAFSLNVLTYLIKLDILDYLVKPISFELFLKACNKARDDYGRKAQPISTTQSFDDRFFSTCDRLIEKVFYDDLRYAEAMLSFYFRQKRNSTYALEMPLKYLQKNV
ncbi:MAG: two component transcriptional regulator, LytTR family [Mucilaginibacter sp.]|nr:two component transcriptional regulator, LytTR family [Mucilaginibacter sp.]